MMCSLPLFSVSHKRQNLEVAVGVAVSCLLGFSAALLPAVAQEGRSLPGCEAPVPLRRELDAKLDYKMFESMKFSSRIARQLETVDQFNAKYPREAEASRRLIDLTWAAPSLIPVVQERLEKQAKSNPDDPLAHALAGYSLTLADPQRAVQELSLAKTKAPAFPLPYLLLAEIYSLGNTADPKALAENLTGYFDLCPTSTDSEAQRLIAKLQDTTLQARVAKALRARLETEKDSTGLKAYETLWALEFRTHPPQEHPALRRQVTADLKRMESLNRKPDAGFQALLVRGYKQSDAPAEKAKAWEDRIIREYSKSSEALFVVQSHWDKAHPTPEDQKDAAAWARWEQEYKAALKTWIRDFPDDFYLQHNAWTNAIEYDDNLSENEVLQVFQADLDDVERSWSPSARGYMFAAEFLLLRKVQPRRALEALRLAEARLAQEHREDEWNKNRSPQQEKEVQQGEVWRDIVLAQETLAAARQLQDPALAQSVRAGVEGSAPQDEGLLSYYWWNRGRLAVVENRRADALAYYQLAYKTRKEPPQWWRGKFYDELGDDARALWKDVGGTEAAFDVWSKPAKPQELAEGYWEKSTRQLPEFELVDLSGKTWRLKELRGKAVLINVWATWCGPCQAELPHIQKLYDRLRDSADLLVLTVNVDEDLGLVEPYLKEKGYGFPVLPGYGFVSNVLNASPGIPQTWIVDSKGLWQWTQMGFGAATDWEDIVTNKLKTAEAAN
jgi:thiol-disulfide isomerase/thioredoxin